MTGPTVPKRKKLTYTVGSCQRIRMSWIFFFSEIKFKKGKPSNFLDSLHSAWNVLCLFVLILMIIAHSTWKKSSPSKYPNIVEKFNISSHILHILIDTVLRKSSNHNDGKDCWLDTWQQSVASSLIDTLHEEGRPQKVIVRKWYIINREDRRLERTDRQSWLKNLVEPHKEQTKAGVSASRAVTHRQAKEMCYGCCIPSV